MKVTFNTLGTINYQKSLGFYNHVVMPENKYHNQTSLSGLYYTPLNILSEAPQSISFCGVKDNNKKIFIGAEMPQYHQKGGVATVMDDYSRLDGATMVIPYYNGKVEYNEKGEATGKVSVLKDKNGNPIYTNQDLDLNDMDSVLEVKDGKKKYVELEEVKRSTMPWGIEDKSEIVLYRVKSAPTHYMVYTDMTALMKEPYADGSYSSAIDKQAKDWEGSAYAKFDKAFVKLCPSIDEAKDAATVVCSDKQGAYVPFYMGKEVAFGNPYWMNVKPAYIAHNLGDGYIGRISAKTMAVNLGLTKSEIAKIVSDPDYLKSFTSKEGEDGYFKNLMPELIDEEGRIAEIMIPLRYREQGYLSGFSTVAELYHQDIVKNPEMAKGIKNLYTKLDNDKKACGILNALNNPKLRHDNPLTGLPYYTETVKMPLKNGGEKILEAYQTFPSEPTLEDVKKVKTHNKISLLSRVTGECADSAFIAGKAGKQAELLGHIDPKYIEDIKTGKDIKLIVGWGRADFQKALDSVIRSFMRFASTDEGKDYLLVLGGDLNNDRDTAQKVRLLMAQVNSDNKLRGRIAYLGGYAPGTALAAAGDASMSPSRTAPCELIDFEAMKKLCTPIVTGTQGLLQKNFDKRYDKPESATSFRTAHQYFITADAVGEIKPEFKTQINELKNKVKTILKNRGISKDLDKLADKYVTTKNELFPEINEKYKELLGNYRDSIIEDELVDALHEFAHSTTEEKQIRLNNWLKLDTTWFGNGVAHPSGKSTGKLYEDEIFNSKQEVKMPTVDFSEKLHSFVNNISKKVSVKNPTTGEAENISKTAKKTWKNMNTVKKTLILSSIVAVALDVGAVVKYYNGQKKRKAEALKADDYRNLEAKNKPLVA